MSESDAEALQQISIKGVPSRVVASMTRLANKRGQPKGVWLTELVERAERDQSGDLVEPGRFSPPAVLPPVAPAALEPPRLMLSVADLAQLVEFAQRSETPAAKRLAGQLLTDYLKAARAAVRAGQDL